MTSAAAISEDEYRRVLGHLPTSVAVISACTEEGPCGMTVGSVTSVSLTPRMILFCPARTSETWSRIRAEKCFCINVLAAGDEALARRFAGRAVDRFAGTAWHLRACGVGLDSAAAWIDCAIAFEHDAGDHTIVVADVKSLDAASHLHPLIFWGGGFSSLMVPKAQESPAASA
jgi:flavin reductase (DIM6/NTAB) family NADH-FMN oxidoreductase RutF